MNKFKNLVLFSFLSLFMIGILGSCGSKHIHDYGKIYYKDTTTHWKECTCGEKVNKTEHIFGEWITTTEPTEETVGSKKQVCGTCNYENIVEIPKIIITFVINFDSNGGSIVDDVEVNKGDKIKKPEDPTKLGYTFEGWYIDNEKWVFNGYPVTENMTLTAHWIHNEYQLVLNTEGVEEITTVHYNDEFTLPTLEKEGYVFEGWYDENNIKYESGNYTYLNDLYLTAKFRLYQVTFDTNGGNEIPNYESDTYILSELPIPEKEDYIFSSWYCNGELVIAPFEYNSDVTLIAKWVNACDEFEYVPLDNSKAKIVSYTGTNSDVIIPQTINGYKVVEVTKDVFANNKNITSVILPSTLTTIEDGLLNGCNLIESIQISDDIPSTLKGLFGASSSKQIPESLIRISYNNGSSIINNDFFDILEGRTFKIVLAKDIEIVQKENINGCVFADSIDIPNGVTLSLDSFVGCKNLLNIEFPVDVKFIGELNYRGCGSLTKVFIPEDIKEISFDAFSGCSSLTELNFPDGVVVTGQIIGLKNIETLDFSNVIFKGDTFITHYAFSGCTMLKYIKLPDNITYIGNYAFENCSSLVEITIPDSASISYNCFQGCTSLTKITLPKTLTGISEYMFSGCVNLQTIILPEKLKSIYRFAFAYCRSLRNIVLSEGVVKIYESAFIGCSNLETIVLPYGLNELSNSTFSGCSSLTSIEIPETVTSIGRHAFSGCSSLTSVIIPKGVTNIGDSAFSGCSSLTSVYYTSTSDEWNNINIGNNNQLLTNATRYYYSETKPTTSGNYWYYDEDEVTPVVW